MREKYIVRGSEGFICGIRYNEAKKQVLIGGPVGHQNKMKELLLCLLDVSGKRHLFHWISWEKSRVRFTIPKKITQKIWEQWLVELEKECSIETVTCFRRLMG